MVVHNDPILGVVVLTSQEKWDRTKMVCQYWAQMLDAGHTELPFKQLESDRGFLVYVAGAYPAMKPYLKGFHLSLESWQGGRDKEGWKLNKGSLDEDQPMWEAGRCMTSDHGPPSGLTQVVPRFRSDLAALVRLTAAASPARRVIRRKGVVTALYGFGDASAGRFGASVGFTHGVRGRFRVWGADAEDKSSNYQEL